MCHRRGLARCGYHRTNDEAYRAARQADLERLEYDTRLFPGDVKLWRESHSMITFKTWLTGGRAR